MGNEVKTVMNLTSANDKIKHLEAENKKLRAAALYYKDQCEKKNAKIKNLEDSLLNAVTNLGWER